MVDFNQISKTADQLSRLFSKIIDSPTTGSQDKETAAIGLEMARRIIELMRQYEKKPSHAILKRIYSSFMGFSRGLAEFTDHDLNNAFNEMGNDIYNVMVDLQQNIKW